MRLAPHGTGPQAARLAAHSGKAKGIINSTGIIAAPLTVGRIFEDQFNVELLRSTDPLQLARWYVTTIQGPVIRANPGVTYFEGPNEQAMGSIDDMIRYSVFEAERARILRQEYSVGAAVGCFATGNPQYNFIPYFQTAIDAANQYGGVLAIHEYGNTLPAATQVAGHFLLGFYKMWLDLDPQIKIVITEFGMDCVPPDGKPWRELRWTDAEGNEQAWTDEGYAIWLWGYELEIRKEPRILAAFIFCFGGGERWKDFELENSRVADLLIEFDRANPEKEPTMTNRASVVFEYDNTADVMAKIEQLAAYAVSLGFVRKSIYHMEELDLPTAFKAKMLQAFTLFSGAGYDRPRMVTGGKVLSGNVLEVTQVVRQDVYPFTEWLRIKSPGGWLPYDPSWVVKL